jgi:hypothetical protein
LDLYAVDGVVVDKAAEEKAVLVPQNCHLQMVALELFVK